MSRLGRIIRAESAHQVQYVLPRRSTPEFHFATTSSRTCSSPIAGLIRCSDRGIGQVSTACLHLRSLETVRNAEMPCDLVNHCAQLVSIESLTWQRLCFLECRHLPFMRL